MARKQSSSVAERQPHYDYSETILQISRDLQGAIRLGQMQTELLRNVQQELNRLSQLQSH